MLHFCTSKTGEVIKQNVNLNPFSTNFTKMALVTIYILQTSKTGSHFLHKASSYLLKMFLGTITMVKVPKNADMCQILGNFAVPLVKSLSNTKRASTGS